jgi:hypothetical protein
MTDKEQTTGYEAPEVFELGDAQALTQFNQFADWPEVVGVRFIFSP